MGVSCCPCVMGVSHLECIFPYQSSWNMLSTTFGQGRMLQCDRLIKSNMKDLAATLSSASYKRTDNDPNINAEFSVDMDAYLKRNVFSANYIFELNATQIAVPTSSIWLPKYLFLPILRFGTSTPSWCHRLKFC